MGYPMAGHLKRKGDHDVTVYNRTATKAAAWVKEYGGGRWDSSSLIILLAQD